MLDEGKSAFKGKHRTEGALGRFLEAVKQGDVVSGSILIIESLDRLTREDIDTALELFLGILRSGIDIVSLVDGQWYSREAIKREPTSLITSIVSLWRANEESRVKADRIGRAWEQKRKDAIERGVPLTSRCPGWLRLDRTGKRYELVTARAQKVRLVYWLTLRGWSRERIAKLFNRHKVPAWGDGRRAANGRHPSYITKLLDNRAVLGEFLPHSGRGGLRKPIGGQVKGYFPPVISETMFLRVQSRRPGPRGRVGPNITNLFRGLCFDGDHPAHGMHIKDWVGGGDPTRCYLRSDYRRLAPQDEPPLSWNYAKLERLVLNYLGDLDWPSLTAGKTQELRRLAERKEVLEGKLIEVGRQMKRLLSLARLSGELADLAVEIKSLATERDALASELGGVEGQVAIKREFGVREMQELLQQLAGKTADFATRLKLRDAVRRLVEAIYIHRKVPEHLAAGLRPQGGSAREKARIEPHLRGKCIRLVFRNGAERWLLPSDDADYEVLRLDGVTPPDKKHLTVVQDELGGRQVTDQRFERKLAPVKADRKARAAGQRGAPVGKKSGRSGPLGQRLAHGA